MGNEDKQWMMYSPEGRNTEYDHKMNLRNMVNSMGMLGPRLPITIHQRNDFEDDQYILNLDGDQIVIRASEKGQKNDAEPGIFFCAKPSKKDRIEKMLVRLFEG